jgi:hypothetical protein
MTYLETPCAIRNYPNLITQSPDAIKLREVFNHLTECKDDEQQRSWALHEDESMIKDNIRHLNGILVCQHFLKISKEIRDVNIWFIN